METLGLLFSDPSQIEPNVGNSDKSMSSPIPSRNQPPLIGAGLSNLGNTCFLNAVLQCITHTVPLLEKLRSADHPACSDMGARFCCLCALKDHVEQCLLMSGQVISPTCFADNLSTEISSDFELGRQEDAHEFLRCLLDSLHSCCLDPSLRDTPSSFEADSLVNQVFSGRLRSQLRCPDCGHCSDTFEPVMDLSLEIDNADSITEALRSFTMVEKMEDEENKVTCGGCQCPVLMEKQLTLDQAPPVVALHLKRFKVDGYFTQKIDKFVKYELEIDLKPFLGPTENEDQTKYELYAVVVHIGCGQFWGHYFSLIRSFPSTWHAIDDSKVMPVRESDVLNQQAYLLFYIKQGSAPWFSSIMEKQKMPHPENYATDTSPTSVLDCMCKDPASPPVAENSCSTSSDSEEEDEGSNPNLCAFTQSTEWMFEPLILTPPKVSNLEFNNSSTIFGSIQLSTTQVKRRPTPEECGINTLLQEPLDAGVVFQFPQTQRESKGPREAGNPSSSASKAVKAVNVQDSVKKLVRGMPSSRRDGFLSCIAQQHQSQSKSFLVAKSKPLDKKRRMSLEQQVQNATRRGLF